MPKITKPMPMRVKAAATAAFLVLAAGPAMAAPPCVKTSYRNTDYVVCRVEPQAHDIRLFLNKADGAPFGHFNWVNEALEKKGETLVFAMNAGMYHEDRAPVGLYVEAGEELAPLNDNDGPGNFHLKPNGVFYVTRDGAPSNSANDDDDRAEPAASARRRAAAGARATNAEQQRESAASARRRIVAT